MISKNIFYKLLTTIIWLIEKIWHTEPPPDIIHIWQIRIGSGFLFKAAGVFKMELREGKEVDVEVVLTTRGGHAAAYQTGSEQWSSSDESVVSVTVDAENPLKATVKGLDGSNNTSVVIEFRADGDPDADETREIVLTGDIVCTQGEAVTGEIAFGEIRDSE